MTEKTQKHPAGVFWDTMKTLYYSLMIFASCMSIPCLGHASEKPLEPPQPCFLSGNSYPGESNPDVWSLALQGDGYRAASTVLPAVFGSMPATNFKAVDFIHPDYVQMLSDASDETYALSEN